MLIETPIIFPGGDALLAGVLLYDTKSRRKAPGIVVTGSWLTVKEQMALHYARRLAALGYSAFVFDFSGSGESLGEPRQAEIPERKIRDIIAAADFVSGLDVGLPGGVGWVAICASAQYVLHAISRGARISTFVSVAGWYHNTDTISSFYGGPDGVARRLEIAGQDTLALLQSKQRTMAAAYSPDDELAGMNFPMDYYADPARGAVPAWRNEMAPLSWAHWLLFDGLSAASANRIPTLMIHGPDCALPDNAKYVFDRFAGPKELISLRGDQTDFYDQPRQVDHAIDAMNAWFRQHM